MKTGHKVLSAVVLVIIFVAIGIAIGWDMKEAQLKQYPIHVKDPGTGEISNRIMFHPGDTLTSNEAGHWILWDSSMSRDLQVAYVTDSGTIEILK